MRRTVPILLALALVVAAGIVHGQWTHRWTDSDAIRAAAARLADLPTTLGDWHGEPLEIAQKLLEVGEIAGYVARRYEDQVHHDSVTILLVCGRPGPIAVHTPDVCYTGTGFQLVGALDAYTPPTKAPQPRAVFNNALMGTTHSPSPSYLRILWAWSALGAWEAPQNPRVAYAAREVLYKLYVIHEPNGPNALSPQDPGPRFLSTLLPVLERTLFPDSNRNGAAGASPARSGVEADRSHRGVVSPTSTSPVEVPAGAGSHRN